MYIFNDTNVKDFYIDIYVNCIVLPLCVVISIFLIYYIYETPIILLLVIKIDYFYSFSCYFFTVAIVLYIRKMMPDVQEVHSTPSLMYCTAGLVVC